MMRMRVVRGVYSELEGETKTESPFEGAQRLKEGGDGGGERGREDG